MKKSLCSVLILVLFLFVSSVSADTHNEPDIIPQQKPFTIYVIDGKDEIVMIVTIEKEVFEEQKLVSGQRITLNEFLSLNFKRENHYKKKEK